MGKIDRDELREYLDKVTKTLLYLSKLSEDRKYEATTCIFNIVLMSLLAGPKEVEKLHEILHDHAEGLMNRMDGQQPGFSVHLHEGKE